MKEKRFYLECLLMKLKEKTGAEDFTMKGFTQMSLVYKEATKKKLDPKYLKYTLYDGKSKSSTRDSKLDEIADYLGYTNFRSFMKSMDVEVDPILQSMEGVYYCYVRMNMEQGRVLRSPVKIFMKDGLVSYYLKGERLNYKGEMKKREGCLFVLMQSADGTKSFYHVYRIGNMPSPKSLQGIFSGVSSDFKPIGGRAVLLRTEESFDSLKTKKIDVKAMQRSKQADERALGEYFQNKKDNNLSINNTATFDPRDLNEG